MSRSKNSGRIFQIIDGVHKDHIVIALNRDQDQKIQAAGKFLVSVSVEPVQMELPMFYPDADTLKKMDSKKVLVDRSNVKLIGFYD